MNKDTPMQWEKLLSGDIVGKKSHTAASTEHRSAFERDFDRVVFSTPFRRLQDKTQVFPLPKQDFVHNRLTHSLEVSSVGRSLGREAGAIILKQHPELKENYTAVDFGAIVAAAALAHDIGNPPFGHAGETAISDFFNLHPQAEIIRDKVDALQWADLINFEGNAQGFRLLTTAGGAGLRVTEATALAFAKYPLSSSSAKIEGRKSQKKYGYYQAEAVIMNKLATKTGLLPLSESSWCRHPLTFLVEAADDICYNIIDLEDGCRLGLISFEEVKQLFAKILKDRFNEQKLASLKDEEDKLGVLRALVIGQLITEVTEVFAKKEPFLLDGTFDQALTDIIPTAAVLAEISKVSVEKIYRSRIVLEKEATGFEVIGKLLEKFCFAIVEEDMQSQRSSGKTKSLLRLLPATIQANVSNAKLSFYEKLLSLLDYISGLTDSQAIDIYQKLIGARFSDN